MQNEVPEQDLGIDLSRMSTLPTNGLMIRYLKPVDEHKNWVARRWRSPSGDAPVSSDPLDLVRGEVRSNRVRELLDVDGLAERAAGKGGQLVRDTLQLGDVAGAPVVNL